MNESPHLSLQELQQAFAHWRQTRQPRYVPTELRLNALALLERHGTAVVLRTLAINHTMLSRWKRQYSLVASDVDTPAFVALPECTERPLPPVMAEPSSGAAAPLRLTIRRDAAGLELNGTLSIAQWQTALSLLEPMP